MGNRSQLEEAIVEHLRSGLMRGWSASPIFSPTSGRLAVCRRWLGRREEVTILRHIIIITSIITLTTIIIIIIITNLINIIIIRSQGRVHVPVV